MQRKTVLTASRCILFCILAFSLSGCGIARPKGFICQLDAPDSVLLCYDMAKDYDENGKLKAGVEVKEHAVSSLNDLDKSTVFDKDSWAEVETYMEKVKAKLKQCETPKNGN